MATKTHLDQVIEQLDGEIAVLQAAKARLVQQQNRAGKPAKVETTVPPLRRAQAKALAGTGTD